MKGLLLKDLYMIMKHFKMYLLIDVIFIAVAFFSDENMMFLVVPMMLASVIPITLLAYDERSHWTEYCGSLPYGRAQIVSAKYLIGLLMEAATALVVFAALLIKDRSGAVDQIFGAVFVMFVISLMFPTFCLPFSLKFGTEKGRLIYYVVIAAAAGIIALTANRVDDITFLLNANTHLLPLLYLGMPVLYALSWLLSIILYNNKEVGK